MEPVDAQCGKPAACGSGYKDVYKRQNRAREAAKKARESIRRKTALGGAAMPDKLRDCNENNPELTEIYRCV